MNEEFIIEIVYHAFIAYYYFSCTIFLILEHYARYSGTDIYGSVITEKREFSAKDCQEQCAIHEECNYFLYFSIWHYQRSVNLFKIWLHIFNFF